MVIESGVNPAWAALIAAVEEIRLAQAVCFFCDRRTSEKGKFEIYSVGMNVAYKMLPVCELHDPDLASSFDHTRGLCLMIRGIRTL